MQTIFQSSFGPMQQQHSARPIHTARVLRAAEEPASRKHHAQTTGKRFARLRNVPPELVPLAAVLALGVGAATFSMGRALLSDPTLRLTPSKKGH